MCQLCILIENSIPYPKAFIQMSKEINIDEAHQEELYNKIIDKIPSELERKEYNQALLNEYYFEFLRNT